MEDAGDAALPLQPAGDLQPGRMVLLQPRGKRAQPARGHVDLIGRDAIAEPVRRLAQRPVQAGIRDGDKAPDPERDLMRIAVVERHGKNGNIATGFVQGFGLKAGAIASTVCHDHHNIIAVGADYGDMALAANRLTEIEGGFVVARDGEILAELALPIAGLMSLLSYEDVREKLVALRAAARSLGVELEEPFLQLAFLALPVIPALKITDRGMVDVTRFEIIPG